MKHPGVELVEDDVIAFPAGIRIFLAAEPVDMRKQFNGLWAVAKESLQLDPFEGAIFAFTNRDRDRVKLLYWDGTGVWVLAKRLEKGRFTWPVSGGSGTDETDLGAGGADAAAVRSRSEGRSKKGLVRTVGGAHRAVVDL